MNGAAEFRANATGRFLIGGILAVIWACLALGVVSYTIPTAAEKSTTDGVASAGTALIFLGFVGLIVALIIFDGFRYIGMAHEVENPRRHKIGERVGNVYWDGKSWRNVNQSNIPNTGGIDYSGETPNGLATFIGQDGQTITAQSGYAESSGRYWQDIDSGDGHTEHYEHKAGQC